VEFRVMSAEDMLGKAAELRGWSTGSRTSRDGWRDDAMLNIWSSLPSETGDIRENTLVPDRWCSARRLLGQPFRRCYVFVDDRMTTVICDPDAPGFRRSRPWQVSYLDIRDHARSSEFLSETGAARLPRASWLEPSGFLEHRAEMAIRAICSGRPNRRSISTGWTGLAADMDAPQFRADQRGRGLSVPATKQAGDRKSTGQIEIGHVRDRQEASCCARANPEHKDQWLVEPADHRICARATSCRAMFSTSRAFTKLMKVTATLPYHVVEC
jgi:hypothetical protein